MATSRVQMQWKRRGNAVYTAPRGGRKFPCVLRNRFFNGNGEWWTITYERDGIRRESTVRPRSVSAH